MYNPLNRLHYIALHNQNDTLGLISHKYQLPAPQSNENYFQLVDYATGKYGDQFIEDMLNIHPDKGVFVKEYSNFVSDDYAARVSKYSLPELKVELVSASEQLKKATEDSEKIDLYDTVAFLQRKIIEKQNEKTIIPGSDKLTKTNHYILLGLAVLAIMFIGSKVFKQ